MARNDTPVSVDETSADAPKRKRASGPRKSKPTYTLFNVTDADGNSIPGAKIELLVATKDADTFMAAQDANPGSVRAKLSLS